MSRKKNKEEALRWLSTGQDDLDTARILKQNQKHAHACFHAQQAVEKAIKGVWYFYDQDPWGHSIVKLINELENKVPGTNIFQNLLKYPEKKLRSYKKTPLLFGDYLPGKMGTKMWTGKVLPRDDPLYGQGFK